MKKISILITGLCLSCNRGGPAMAISFMEQIKKHLSVEFIFAVPANHIDLEKKWGDRYGVKVIPQDSVITWFLNWRPILPLRRLKSWLQGKTSNMYLNSELCRDIHNEFQDEIKKADCLINLNGIAFVGDGTRSWRTSLSERTSSIYARKHKKPFLRFIQSYGPLRDWRVRFLAQSEFSKLPYIMTRGKLAANSCRKVAGEIPVYAFPDVAITLPCLSNKWLFSYLKQFNLEPKNYIVLSPSAVIAKMPTKKGASIGKNHVEVYAKITKHYLALGKFLLFVPHKTSPMQTECDRMLCRQVLDMLTAEGIDTTPCHIVEDELDCRELKTLISASQLAIISRYHALVAAISTGVPSVIVGWNDKYQDLLDFYKSAQFAVDARTGGPSVVTDLVIKKADKWTKNQKNLIKNRQPELVEMVNKAGKLCANWILEATK